MISSVWAGPQASYEHFHASEEWEKSPSSFISAHVELTLTWLFTEQTLMIRPKIKTIGAKVC